MSGIRPRLPSTLQITKMITDTRELVAKSVALLQSLPAPDTFLGRKTHKSFPQEKNVPQADEN
jgi:hypothetical protein